MTTTKKKAKRTLAQRVTALEEDQAIIFREAGRRAEKAEARLTALEQAQRPKELCSVCGGSGEQPGPYTCVACSGDGFVSRAPVAAPPETEKPAARAGELPCPRSLWDSDDAVKDARLRDAVVEAALLWHTDDSSVVVNSEPLGRATTALRAHRAKKGGA